MVRTGTNIEPIRVVWGQLLVVARLHDVDIGGHLELPRALQVGSVCVNESVRAVRVQDIELRC